MNFCRRQLTTFIYYYYISVYGETLKLARIRTTGSTSQADNQYSASVHLDLKLVTFPCPSCLLILITFGMENIHTDQQLPIIYQRVVGLSGLGGVQEI